jgi:transcription elongation GreA/GreB family factor
LGTTLREALLEIVRTRHIAPDVPPWERENVIWTTAASLARRREELDTLLKVDIPANSRAIGEAAARGDLSENAEWTAALDQQKLLASRATQMQKELSMARVLTAEALTQDTVGVGSAVTAEDLDSAERRELTFLGPWDADPDAGVYSYMAPIARAFLGRRVGDTVELPGSPERRCRICEVRAAGALTSEQRSSSDET